MSKVTLPASFHCFPFHLVQKGQGEEKRGSDQPPGPLHT